MTTLASFEVIARILLLIGVGVVLRATHLLTRESAKTLNTVIVYVALPALVFQAVHPAKLELCLLYTSDAADE